MADELNADWRTWDKAICEFYISPTPASLAAVKALLNPDNVMGTGCEVERHPDCCLLCRENQRCENIPVHPNCRCRRKGTLTGSSFGNTLGAEPSAGLSANQQGIKGGPGQG
jgi:hypothetical protein